jgi:predicted lipid-binding transport protein (Tim44 family)
MGLRIAFIMLVLLLLLGLAACFPSPVVSPVEQAESVGSISETPGAMLTTVTPSPSSSAAQSQPEEVQPEQDSDQLLVAPTLAPTATPGVIYAVVEQVVGASNLEATRFIGLSVADWINLAISFLLVFLTLTLIARLIFSILRKFARRTATQYDEIYLDSIRPYLRWLFGVIIFILPRALQFIGRR